MMVGQGKGKDAENDSGSAKIGIAVVENAGQVLVGVRQPAKVLAGHAEFPGGKCENGESPRDCVVRECFEETGLAVEPTELLGRIEFDYPHGTLELHFWLCRLGVGECSEPRAEFRWQPIDLLTSLNFPPANARIVAELIQRFSV